MRFILILFFSVFAITLLLLSFRPTGYEWNLPGYFSMPSIPEHNPMSREKIELGRFLFYDTRLSVNNSTACASCHKQVYAFADNVPFSIGATGEFTSRNSMSLTNVAFNASYTWANDQITSLEQQAILPLTQLHPLEMGIAGHEQTIIDLLKKDPEYLKLFKVAFPDVQEPFTLDNIVDAISCFERSLISAGSPYDRYKQGDKQAMSEAAIRGEALFFSKRLQCSACHGGYNFRFTLGHRKQGDTSVAYHNTGLYNLKGQGLYPETDQGLFEKTGNPKDMGKFKTPTLRNCELTSPYMHDGSIATLEQVIDHYAAGGRTIETGVYAGDGSQNPYKSPQMTGFEINQQEKNDLIIFLIHLTDDQFINNPELSNPIRTMN